MNRAKSYTNVENHQEYLFTIFLLNKFYKKEEQLFETKKTPKELFAEAGYDFYECHSEAEIQRFKKYYTRQERLCTFRDTRLKGYHVFFAVKKNVSDIRREDFLHPEREDEYGTSVLSIQFSRTNPSTLSIKNRYNHTVDNPDATFQNNLELIQPGLTKAFEKAYALTIKYAPITLTIPNYHFRNDGRYHKYNYEINQIYYCCNNTILHGDKLIKLDPAKYLLFDYYILDLQNKKLALYDNDIKDPFINIPEIKNISIQTTKSGETVYLYFVDSTVPMVIKLDKENKMRELIANMIPRLEDRFCVFNKYLEVFESYTVEEIGDDCFRYNKFLSIFRAPLVK